MTEIHRKSLDYRKGPKGNVLTKPISWLGVGFVVLILPHFKTAYFDTISGLDVLLNLARVGSALLAFFIFMMRKERIDKCAAALLALEACLLLSTLINEGSITYYITSCFLGLGVYVLIGLFAGSPRMVASVVFIIGEILTYINLASMIIFPDGLYVSGLLGYYHNWILGYKNQFLPYYLCFLLVAFLEMKYSKKRFRPVLLIAAMFASLIIGDSSTSVIVMLLFLALAILADTKLTVIFNLRLLFGITIAAFVLMVFMNGTELTSQIAAIANRDTTFSGRTIIWVGALKAIAQKPFFGWGIMTDEENIALIGHIEASSAHNYYLELLLTGGAVSLILFCLFVFFLVKKIETCKGSYCAKLFSGALFALSMSYLTEAFSNPILFLIFAFAANTEKFSDAEAKTITCWETQGRQELAPRRERASW